MPFRSWNLKAFQNLGYTGQWFVFAGFGALTLETDMVPPAVRWAARVTPSGALTEALSQAMSLSVDWFGLAVLAVWGALAALAARRWFRFT